MGRPLKLLIIDDSKVDAILISDKLTQNGFDVLSERVDTADALKEQLAIEDWDIIVCDYIMPSFSVMDALAIVKEKKINAPVIVLTSMLNSEIAPDLIKAGASDFVTKDELSKLVAVVEREASRAVKKGREILQREEERLANMPSTGNKKSFITIKKRFAAVFVFIAGIVMVYSWVISAKGAGDSHDIALVLAAVVLGALVLSWYFLMTAVLKPIGEIKTAIERIAEGDLSREMAIKNYDEIGALAHSFDKMRASLKETFEKLKSEIRDRYAAEQALQALHLKLTGWVSELDKRTHEISILNQMGKMLRSCKSVEEFHSFTKRFAEQLFPEDRGAVYLFNETGKFMEVASMWGKEPIENNFAPEECWSLREGHVYSVDSSENINRICGHILTHGINSDFTHSVCVPMIAMGATIGMFHLRSEHKDKDPGNNTEKRKFAKEQLVVAVAEHITLALSNMRLQDTLRQQSTHDTLTGLFNRRHMNDSLEKELYTAQRRKMPFGVVMLDIDHFKKYNDDYGHDVGDIVLQKIGHLVKMTVRPEDIPCRYGGEEFLIILPGANQENTHKCAIRLMEETRKLKIENNGTFMRGITISLGVASYPLNGSTAEQIAKAVDTALFEAKKAGRDRVVISTEIAPQPQLK